MLTRITSRGAQPITMELGQPLDKIRIPVYGVYDDSVHLSMNPDSWSFKGFDPNKLGIQNVTITYVQDGVPYSTVVPVDVVVPAYTPYDTSYTTSSYDTNTNWNSQTETQPQQSLPVQVQPLQQVSPTRIASRNNFQKLGKNMTGNDGHKTAIQVFSGNTGFYAVANKDMFTVREKLNKSDFTVMAVFSGSLVNVPQDSFTVLRFDDHVATPGYKEAQVFIQYGGRQEEVTVFFNVVKPEAVGASLVATTSKIQYFLGDTIDKSSVTVTYKGTKLGDGEWDFTGMDSSKVGPKTITVVYDTTPDQKGDIVLTSFAVDVKPRVNALAAVTTKGEYRYGEAFDYDSLKVTWFDQNGRAVMVPSRSVQIVGFDTTGKSTIDPYVIYNGMKAPINVVEKY
jgi:hypothetical protein